MKEEITLSWIDKMAFGTEVNGHKLIVDAKEEFGGENRGPRPKPLMLVALAGCTGMDVVSILKKMKVKLSGFNVRIEGSLTENHPRHYNKMHIIYTFEGKSLNPEKLQKAVELSQQQYCGVSFSYRKAMEISTEIIVVKSD